MNIIGKNIRQLRQKNGWSQGEVAKRLQISIPAFSKIETGITDINISRLDQIADLFEVSTLEIISEDGEIQRSYNPEEITVLKSKLASQEEEIIKLQKKVIDLYEEIRNK
ncbi:helix-turn-helix domain-containing protein [Pedobacter sp. Hv1]|uniref:helix-turn-helix domain-containing protein n=1 Tax=Pedobacter sp. Hv1 TaxID=1740090 RepID=UPI0006D8BA79|nr:helix-turn-helix transcriptional regulator [Pedobacter sp. Hv1]KQB98975.1 DNA-binding protein [Pedobacter sp. Hv1]